MVATLYLIGCVLVPAQPAPPAPAGEHLFGPRLVKSEEFAYHGTYDEESAGDRVHFSRSYRVDTRIFVLETTPTGADVAIMTVLRPRETSTNMSAGFSSDSGIRSAKLEIVHLDLQGRVFAEPGINLTVPLDGPPTLECGAFVELPTGRANSDGVWIVSEAGRPPRTWQRRGAELVNGTSCAKVTGEQQSEDWEKPRADRGAWRRADTVWIASRLGMAFRVERVIERRDPALRDATHKSVLRYELDRSLQYPGQLSDERRMEINRAKAFADAAAPLLLTPGEYGTQLSALLSRINLHIEHQAPTPYRDAIIQVRRQVEAARRGETPAATPEPSVEPQATATVGQMAPDFVATELSGTGKGSQRLRNWSGKPVLLVFYNPLSQTTEELIGFAKGIDSRFNHAVSIIALSVSDDATVVRRQQTQLGINFPILSGGGLRNSYAVESTPKMILIDAAGVVRGSYVGWGRETASEVVTDIRQWLQRR